MRLDILLLAALPSALAAKLAYAPPADLMSKVQSQDDDCDLPTDYQIKNFSGKSNDTASTLSAFDFTFVDNVSKVTTLCHFNSTSKSTTPGGMTQRYACENGEVKFIWEKDDKDLWMIERVCPGDDGKADYEVSGSVNIPLVCAPKGNCRTNSTSHEALFTSISPVRDPTLI